MWKNRIVGYTEESPDQLLAHYANPRTHDGKQRDAMRASLDELGIIAPCTVNDRSGNMIDGHMRCEEYITAGITKVPVNHLDLSEQEELKAIAFFDRIGALAGTNQENLEYLLENIELDNTPLENLLEDIREKKTVLPEDIDDIPEVETPVSKLGDLWLLDGHRVLCGDSTDQATVELLMRGKKADTAFADPPYNLGYRYNKYDDNKTREEYEQFCKAWFSVIPSKRKIITSGKQNLGMWYSIQEPREVAVWVHKNGVSGGRISNLSLYEPIIFYGEWSRDSRPSNLFEYELERQDTGDAHSCPKQIKLMIDILQHYSDKLIYDPFLGSGSTLIASEQLDRTCYGLELDPLYVDVICKRWQTLTGQLPILEATGEAHDFIGK